MPAVRLPDGSTRSFDRPVTVAEVAQSIGPGLARGALAGKVDLLRDYLSPSAPWLPFRETSFAEYLDTFPATAVNAGMLVGHNTLRLMVMGMSERAPTPAEQRALTQLDPTVMASMKAPPADAAYVPKGLTLGDARTQAMAAYTALRDELTAFDARRLGLKYFVPMLFLQGELDAFTVTAEVRVFADEVEAPRKVFALLEGAGHSAFLMRDEFLASLKRHLQSIG